MCLFIADHVNWIWFFFYSSYAQSFAYTTAAFFSWLWLGVWIVPFGLLLSMGLSDRTLGAFATAASSSQAGAAGGHGYSSIRSVFSSVAALFKPPKRLAEMVGAGAAASGHSDLGFTRSDLS